jgi:23S rRNA (guanine745-N1)-methyltransferase
MFALLIFIGLGMLIFYSKNVCMKALICPLCTLPLNSLPLGERTQGLVCPNRHQFDRAKEGYFNLLPVHYKNSREPGDAKQQLLARREFLAAEYFLPLLDALKKIIRTDVTSLLDIGCGEGYFTRRLGEHCARADIYGLDISKAGVRLAAKSSQQNQTYIVASSQSLPLADASMEVITRIYAPSKDEELFRVLKPKGLVIIVTPGEEHLLALRQKIYQVIKPHPKPVAPQGFKELKQEMVTFPLVVPSGELTAALLTMTPFAWKLSPELLQSSITEGITDTAHFQISVYEKQGN